eukprot:g2979.t1
MAQGLPVLWHEGSKVWWQTGERIDVILTKTDTCISVISYHKGSKQTLNKLHFDSRELERAAITAPKDENTPKEVRDMMATEVRNLSAEDKKEKCIAFILARLQLEKRETVPVPVLELEPELEPEPEMETEPETELATELQTELQTELETELETELQTELQTEIETEMETELETEMETEIETEMEAEVELAQAGPDAEMQAGAEAGNIAVSDDDSDEFEVPPVQLAPTYWVTFVSQPSDKVQASSMLVDEPEWIGPSVDDVTRTSTRRLAAGGDSVKTFSSIRASLETDAAALKAQAKKAEKYSKGVALAMEAFGNLLRLIRSNSSWGRAKKGLAQKGRLIRRGHKKVFPALDSDVDDVDVD